MKISVSPTLPFKHLFILKSGLHQFQVLSVDYVTVVSRKTKQEHENKLLKLPDSLTLQQVLHHVDGAPRDGHHGDRRCLHGA